MIEQYLVSPLPSQVAVSKGRFNDSDTVLGGVHLRCLRYLPPTSPTIPMVYPAYCFAKDLPAIRVVAPYRELLVFFNGIVRFGDQYLAKQIQVKKAGNPQMNIDVTELSSIVNMQEAEIAPPSGAVPAPTRKIAVSPGVIAGNKISGTPPEYPYNAKAARIEGVVILEATITKAGTIGNLRVLTGPSMLQQAALDSVKTWRYKPYLLNGEPVEVETQLNVIFQLSR